MVICVCCRKAEQSKAVGNTFYMSKNYSSAVQLYTEAIGEQWCYV